MVATYEYNKKIQEEDNYYNDPLVNVIRNLLHKNNGKWQGTYADLKGLLEDNYSNIIDSKVNSHRIKPLIPLLKKYDNINFYADKHPRNGKRLITFTKKSVEFVENVESVDNTNNTNSTNNTERNV